MPSQGFDVVGMDVNPRAGDLVNAREAVLESEATFAVRSDVILTGQQDDSSGRLLEARCAEITENGTPYRRLSLESAQLARIDLNAFDTTKIAFANTLADLCEQIPEGDVDAVADALGLDRREDVRFVPSVPRRAPARGTLRQQARGAGRAAARWLMPRSRGTVTE